MAPKRLYVNYSNNKQDILIAGDLIMQLRATRAFKDENIQDSSSVIAGDEAEKSFYNKVEESDAVIHLLSADFQNGNCSKLFDKCLEIGKLGFPVLIRHFPYEFDKRIMTIADELLPEDKEDIENFINQNEKDEIITQIVRKIMTKVGFDHYKNERGKNRKLFYGMIIGFSIIGLMSLLGIYYYTNEFLFACIPFIGFMIIVLFLFYMLKHPSTITLHKT